MLDRTRTRSVWRLGAGAAGLTLMVAGAACGDGGRLDEELPGAESPSPPGRPPGVLPTPVPASTALPAVSGGSLLVTRDDSTVVASDPDRDSVWLLDPGSQLLRKRVQLAPGAEPGRVVEDSDGKVHVALRRGGQVVKIDPKSGVVLSTRSVCAAPRGLAYDAASDNLYVACHGGELVTLKARGGDPLRTWYIDSDLRDVAVKGTHLLVTRFRSSEIIEIDERGSQVGRAAPRTISALPDAMGRPGTASPTTAWRMVPMPDGQVAVLHQRGFDGVISTRRGGYSNGPCKSGIVATSLSLFDGTTPRNGAVLAQVGLAFDVAVSRDGKKLAVIGATTQFSPAGGVTVTDIGSLTGGDSCSFLGSTAMPGPAEPVAGAYDGQGHLWVLSRNPARVYMHPSGGAIALTGAENRSDEGHRIFHTPTQGLIACASCHAEGGDDGHVWNFEGIGPRRTQSLRGGLLATAPFHWDGDMGDLTKLMGDVFTGRMSGQPLTPQQVSAVGSWLDSQPTLPRPAPVDPQAVARGKALFADSAVGCASCHSGTHLTNNASADVGTGKAFQVPSLVGIAERAPFMHTGCASNLRGRFDVACGGGDRHGKTSHLSAGQLDDLVAYLETL